MVFGSNLSTAQPLRLNCCVGVLPVIVTGTWWKREILKCKMILYKPLDYSIWFCLFGTAYKVESREYSFFFFYIFNHNKKGYVTDRYGIVFLGPSIELCFSARLSMCIQHVGKLIYSGFYQSILSRKHFVDHIHYLAKRFPISLRIVLLNP